MTKRIIVGIAGASGSGLALETLRQLANAGAETHVVVSKGARATIQHELGDAGKALIAELASRVHSPDDMTAPIASGSFPNDGMIVVPCSMRTLSAIAHGLGDNLLTRAADVALKEKRRLVVVPREAPLHEGHLRSMLTLARLGATIAPPMPPFYVGMHSIDEMLREIAARLLNWVGVDPGSAMTRWSGLPQGRPPSRELDI